jgi:hypothetical protein
MPMLLDPKNDPVQPMVYEVKVKGHLGPQWTDWFEGLTITLEGDGYTLLTGPVVDQAAMHALLRKVRDLGITLISVNQVKSRPSDSMGVEARTEETDADQHIEDGSA